MIRFRRLVVGLSLIVSPLCGLLWSVTQAPFTGYAGEIAFIRAHTTLWITSTLLGILFSYLFIAAITGVLHLIAQRNESSRIGLVLGYLGAVLACTGSAFHGSVLGFQLVEAPLVSSGMGDGQLLQIISTLGDHPAFSVIVLPVFGLYIGLLLLAIAIWQTRVAKLWLPLLIVLGMLIELFSPLETKARMMFILFLIAFGWMGIKVLRMSDTEWDNSSGKE